MAEHVADLLQRGAVSHQIFVCGGGIRPSFALLPIRKPNWIKDTIMIKPNGSRK